MRQDLPASYDFLLPNFIFKSGPFFPIFMNLPKIVNYYLIYYNG